MSVEEKANRFIDYLRKIDGIGEYSYIDEDEITEAKNDFIKAYDYAPKLMNLILEVIDK